MYEVRDYGGSGYEHNLKLVIILDCCRGSSISSLLVPRCSYFVGIENALWYLHVFISDVKWVQREKLLFKAHLPYVSRLVVKNGHQKTHVTVRLDYVLKI